MIRQRQLPTNANGITEFDPFAAPDPQATQPDDSPIQILFKLHRLLRGRYLLAISLAALGAVGGAIGGYMATGPKWQSNGAIRIEPTRPVYLDRTPETDIPHFDSFVQDQVIALEEQKTLDRAMESEPWQKLERGQDMRAKRTFRDSLSVSVDRASRKWIKVRFVDADPDAARVAVQQIIDAYRVIFGPDLLLATTAMIQKLQGERAKLELEIKAMDTRLDELRTRHGTTDLTTLERNAIDALTLAQEEFQALADHVGQVEAAARARPPSPEAPDKPAPVLDWQQGAFEIARVDQTMSRLIEQREAARTDKLRLEQNYSPESWQFRRVKDLLTALDTQIEQRYKEWMAAHGNTLPAQGAGVGPAFAVESLEVLKANRDFKEGVAARRKEEAIKISATRREIEGIKDEMAAKKKDLTRREERLNDLSFENTSSITQTREIGRVEIISDGDEATFYSDGRKKLGALGFLLGGSLPVFAVMLLGAMDRRFRYSDDAQSGAARVPLLGILPYLPDTVNDPEQAGIAAHCVHQIRTLLQIGGVEHDRKVFAITSATSGDGKTSLCLSLGLSFAASGSSTCLIDFDLVGGGLTAAMGARTDVGLLAAIDDGQLDGHIRPTAFPRLSLIPSGRHDAQEISRLSPKLVRRLIDQTRKEFDVIIIDTGPILGSIEATLVAGCADGVILALGRGQQRSLATRAIDTLRGVGAHIMGVVFNRAERHDFKRTVSQSVRSVPVQDAGSSMSLKALPAMGPMARTVVSQLRPDS